MSGKGIVSRRLFATSCSGMGISMKNREEMKMTYSGIVVSDGRKKIFVTFEAGEAYAEAVIPDCKVTKSVGFEEDELVMLEKYLQMNQVEIAKMAKEISGLRGFMK